MGTSLVSIGVPDKDNDQVIFVQAHGKSFICNILIGKEVFAHAYQSEAVTHNTAFYDVTFGLITYKVFDIPGLIEPDQKRIDSNGIEIQKAFQLCPSSIVLFVFSGG
ncbi:unnamed protein product [Didymodactylos carnosus]|uniref:G domain-containing protein n=1 Tax=Didymodactylos carnosus TaxID=1234261 RepID=A0A8S2VKQ0_9BILA|nr:unnamed protein product [Didymodactylos carnosus]CAF4401594.1 unnamed protein product [Didymodactylos carnosus]